MSFSGRFTLYLVVLKSSLFFPVKIQLDTKFVSFFFFVNFFTIFFSNYKNTDFTKSIKKKLHYYLFGGKFLNRENEINAEKWNRDFQKSQNKIGPKTAK